MESSAQCVLVFDSVRSRASEQFQFIVISLKNSFWEKAAGLVGIWRDLDAGSSSVLTLDVGLSALSLLISLG